MLGALIKPKKTMKGKKNNERVSTPSRFLRLLVSLS